MRFFQSKIFGIFLSLMVNVIITVTASTERCDEGNDCDDGSDQSIQLLYKFHNAGGSISNNPQDIRERAPWVAAIFQNISDGKWIYLCGGTITSTSTVITTASCVQEDKGSEHTGGVATLRHIRYSTLRVVAGLRSADYADRDQHTQEAEVGMIREHKSSSNGHNQNFRNVNLAGIRLKSTFKFSSFVRSVSLVEVPDSPQEILTTQEGQQVVLAGFDQRGNLSLMHDSQIPIPKAPLEMHSLMVLGSLDCFYKYPHGYKNVFCTKFSDESKGSVPCSMEGHGMIVLERDGTQLYLMGVYTSNSARYEQHYEYPTMSQSDTKCGLDDVIFFTKYSDHWRWAISHDFCGKDLLQCQSGKCRPIVELCDGVANCEDKTDESETVCFNQRDCTPSEFRCSYGACISDANEKICDGNQDCEDNSDECDDARCEEAEARKNLSSSIPASKRYRCAFPKRLLV